MMRALIDSLRFVTHLYCFENQPGILKNAVSKIEAEFGRETSEETTKKFITLYPPKPILESATQTEKFLTERAGTSTGEELTDIEMILLNLTTSNPALKKFINYYDDSELKSVSSYLFLIEQLELYFARQPNLESVGLSLFSALRMPMNHAPDSLA